MLVLNDQKIVRKGTSSIKSLMKTEGRGAKDPVCAIVIFQTVDRRMRQVQEVGFK